MIQNLYTNPQLNRDIVKQKCMYCVSEQIYKLMITSNQKNKNTSVFLRKFPTNMC